MRVNVRKFIVMKSTCFIKGKICSSQKAYKNHIVFIKNPSVGNLFCFIKSLLVDLLHAF